MSCVSRIIEPGERIGHYEIVRLLGVGGMGQVYEVHDIELDRICALKTLHAEIMHKPSVVRRFYAEMKILARLNHRAIVKIYTFGREKGFCYFVQEFIAGYSLDAYLRKSGPMNFKQVLAVAHAMVNAFAYFHPLGILHRDMKPANIMYDKEQRRFVLMDFGLVLAADMTRLTEEGNMVGTLGYLPPEILAGADNDVQTDIYQLGLVLYELSVGNPLVDSRRLIRPPFDELKQRLILAEGLDERLPSWFAAFVRKCIHPDKSVRFADARAMKRWLAGKGGRDGGGVPRGGSRPKPDRRRSADSSRDAAGRGGGWRAAAGVLVLCCVLASVLWWLFGGGGGAPSGVAPSSLRVAAVRTADGSLAFRVVSACGGNLSGLRWRLSKKGTSEAMEGAVGQGGLIEPRLVDGPGEFLLALLDSTGSTVFTTGVEVRPGACMSSLDVSRFTEAGAVRCVVRVKVRRAGVWEVSTPWARLRRRVEAGGVLEAPFEWKRTQGRKNVELSLRLGNVRVYSCSFRVEPALLVRPRACSGEGRWGLPRPVVTEGNVVWGLTPGASVFRWRFPHGPLEEKPLPFGGARSGVRREPCLLSLMEHGGRGVAGEVVIPRSRSASLRLYRLSFDESKGICVKASGGVKLGTWCTKGRYLGALRLDACRSLHLLRIAARRYVIVCVDSSSGECLWNAHLNACMDLGSMVAVGGALFVAHNIYGSQEAREMEQKTGAVTILRLEDGRLLRRLKGGNSIPLPPALIVRRGMGGRIVVKCFCDGECVVHVLDGRRWTVLSRTRYPVPPRQPSQPMWAGDGGWYCLYALQPSRGLPSLLNDYSLVDAQAASPLGVALVRDEPGGLSILDKYILVDYWMKVSTDIRPACLERVGDGLLGLLYLNEYYLFRTGGRLEVAAKDVLPHMLGSPPVSIGGSVLFQTADGALYSLEVPPHVVWPR